MIRNRDSQQAKNPPFDDYSAMKLNNGSSAPPFLDHDNNSSFNIGVWTNDFTRKRAREEDTRLQDTLLMSQQPEFIGLRHLFSGQQNVVSTGLGLAFHNRQSVSPQSSNRSSPLLSREFVSQIKQQNDEIDHFIISQGEQMRRTLAEKRQRQYTTLLIAAEESAARRLTEKETEVAKAVRRHAELESKANQITLEVQAWQARARMQENYAAALQIQLQQAIVTGGGGQVQDVDVDGGGGSTAVGGEAEDAGSAFIDPDRVIPTGPNCKSCRSRVASVVLLPCRHLCLCSECDAVAQACPACLAVRSSSIEVLFS